MQKIFLTLLMIYSVIYNYSQNSQYKVSRDSVVVDSHVEFFIYNGPYGYNENVTEPAIKFILTVENKGIKPIPDLCVSNRSKFVNLYINDSIYNPVSLYNGTETIAEHVIKKNDSDTYTWWIFENEAYGKSFTVQWEYMGLFSKKIKINLLGKTIEVIE